MISDNIENLVFAGRNISVTHAALSSSRVMATCSILGQALGTAIAQALGEGCHVADVDVERLQQTLMEDDCFIPFHTRCVPEIVKSAQCTAEVVRNGVDRGEENCWVGRKGDVIEYTFPKDTAISQVRLVFDSDLNRDYHNMPCNIPLEQKKFKLPSTLISHYRVEALASDGTEYSLEVNNNHQRFVKHFVDWNVKTLRFIPLATHGCEEFHLFSFEVR